MAQSSKLILTAGLCGTQLHHHVLYHLLHGRHMWRPSPPPPPPPRRHMQTSKCVMLWWYVGEGKEDLIPSPCLATVIQSFRLQGKATCLLWHSRPKADVLLSAASLQKQLNVQYANVQYTIHFLINGCSRFWVLCRLQGHVHQVKFAFAWASTPVSWKQSIQQWLVNKLVLSAAINIWSFTRTRLLT